MNIQPIVEGHGEVAAVPILLRRLRDLAQVFALDVNAPVRRKRSELIQESGLRRSVRLARIQPNCACIIVLFDSDHDCPKEVAPRLQQWAQEEAGNIPCRVALATKEFEAWFIGSIESLRGVRGISDNAVSHPDPETPRGAKSQLEARMLPDRSYSETADQPALSAKFDMQPVYKKCRSFRHLVKVFGELATMTGLILETWPPQAWQDPPETGLSSLSSHG
jgi:hypothetical protein